MKTTHNNKELAQRINDHLRSGGVVQVTTYLKSTLYTEKHAGWFSCSDTGVLTVQFGRRRLWLSLPKHGSLLVCLRMGRMSLTPILDPLELTVDLHICLWSEDRKHKWSVAYWTKDKEGYDLKFVGDRPLDERVNWDHFKMLIRFGQQVADARFEEESEDYS